MLRMSLLVLALIAGCGAARADAVPPMPDFPYVYTVTPDQAAEPGAAIAAARSVIARWQAWQAKNGSLPAFADWVNARHSLIAVGTGDARFAQAKLLARALDTFGSALADAEIEKIKQADTGSAEDRHAFAVIYEREMLRKWMSATVTVEGEKATTLRIEYALISKAFAFNMSENYGLLERYRDKGFKRVLLTNGNQSWIMDLRKIELR